jgi:hypothetical protein
MTGRPVQNRGWNFITTREHVYSSQAECPWHSASFCGESLPSPRVSLTHTIVPRKFTHQPNDVRHFTTSCHSSAPIVTKVRYSNNKDIFFASWNIVNSDQGDKTGKEQ